LGQNARKILFRAKLFIFMKEHMAKITKTIIK